VLGALDGAGERGGHVEDDLALLQRDDAACGKRAAVAVAEDLEDSGLRGVARAQEVAVQRVRAAVRLDRQSGRAQRLRGDLTAVQRVGLLEDVAAAVDVRVDLLERHHLREGALDLRGVRELDFGHEASDRRMREGLARAGG
jgi:hypothetical protein